jgi:hypothetical protein
MIVGKMTIDPRHIEGEYNFASAPLFSFSLAL